MVGFPNSGHNYIPMWRADRNFNVMNIQMIYIYGTQINTKLQIEEVSKRIHKENMYNPTQNSKYILLYTLGLALHT